ncbi:MAG: molybdopterin-guanine dinucleotide biosynthesis protein B [Methylococcales symbiont of Hymedesmia sp. n. MRB-2018]|nr:MAG: molybdopterin-guanine dinucleotide biosynthesis protein B [Methylococcales symbiont of Hymedesmia sp. n. MRB-2018]KAF3983127.1 MAG: molybdopterin-guanine dinucleotide biosynthesis protein B [Methylococcales symbiont of Hymedesmia sp. n. MRB-2018]
MKNAQIPILGFAAYSGTGKTTLLTQLIPLLQNSDIRVGLIKHCHHNFEIDKPDKDSYRLRKAGASPVMLVSSHRRAIITEFKSITEPELDIQLKFFDQSELDLILVEGFKAENLPKIELYRPSLNHPLLFPNDPGIIAIATDKKIAQLSNSFSSESTHPALLEINNPGEICSFIMHDFLRLTK